LRCSIAIEVERCRSARSDRCGKFVERGCGAELVSGFDAEFVVASSEVL
jgi:hypothetical protein